MNYDYETLKLLREYTVLDPISYFKVTTERERANRNQQIINKVEHCCLGADFTKANNLEIDLRFKIWKRKVFIIWNDSYSHMGLNEFALDYLYHNNEKKRVLKR